LRWSIATTWAVLVPSLGAPDSALTGFAVLATLGDFLARVAFLLDLPFAGAPLALCASDLAFLVAFGLATRFQLLGGSGSGCYGRGGLFFDIQRCHSLISCAVNPDRTWITLIPLESKPIPI
jgi:hypothetical protein